MRKCLQSCLAVLAEAECHNHPKQASFRVRILKIPMIPSVASVGSTRVSCCRSVRWSLGSVVLAKRFGDSLSGQENDQPSLFNFCCIDSPNPQDCRPWKRPIVSPCTSLPLNPRRFELFEAPCGWDFCKRTFRHWVHSLLQFLDPNTLQSSWWGDYAQV